MAGTTGDTDGFGYALATGDFNGDGYDDVAVGAPGDTEHLGGSVDIIMGSSAGITGSSHALYLRAPDRLCARRVTRSPTLPVATTLATLFVVPPSGAQERFFAEREPAAVLLTVDTDDPNRTVEIIRPPRDPRPEQVVHRCRPPCAVHLEPDLYQIALSEAPDSPGGRRWVRLKNDTHVNLTSRGYTGRWVGLSLGIVGAAAIPVGLYMLLESGLGGWRVDGVDTGLLALGVMGGGAVTSAVGWILYAQSFGPGLDLQPIEPSEARDGPAVRLTAGPSGTTGLGAHVSF